MKRTIAKPIFRLERPSIQVKYVVLGILLFSTLFVMGCSDKNVVIDHTPYTFYGEMYLNESPTSFTISTAGIYYNVTGLACGPSNEVTCNDSGIFIVQPGVYNIKWSLSFSGGNNNQYHMGVVRNHNFTDKKCLAERHTSSNLIGSVSDGCFLRLNGGDQLTATVEDEANPAASVTFYHGEFSVVYLGP